MKGKDNLKVNFSTDRKSQEERQANIPLSSGYSTVSSDSTPRTSIVNYYGLKEISEVRRTDNCLDDFLCKVRRSSNL